MEAALARGAVNAVHIPLQFITTLNVMQSLWPPQAEVNDGDTFDFIIVGSGVGSVVANRLTENINCSVLLIEAGKNPSLEGTFPGTFPELQDSYQDWKYKSEAEEATQSQENEVFKLAVGKTLGGSSVINHFVFVRGDKLDFDSWAKYLNDSSWKYDNTLQYFKKSENVEVEEIRNSAYAEFHGFDGPVKLTKESYKSADKYLKAFEETGTPAVLDINGNDTVGYTESMLTIADGLRQHLGLAYLKSIKGRKNLHVYREALVTKINFEGKVAKSVQVINKSNKNITVYARKEIIVCAGTINSPKLLLQSGIGPVDTLNNLHIPIISEVPVGQYLQDHVAVAFVHKMEPSLEISELPSLTKLPFPLIIGGVTLDKMKPYSEYQTTNLVLTHDTPYLLVGCVILFGYKDELCQELNDNVVGRNSLFSLVSVLHPESRGLVTLRSSDPMDPPIIRESFYSDPSDLDNMVRYIEDFLRIDDTTYFKSVNAELVKLKLPQCSNFTYRSSPYWKCYVKYMSTSLYHYTSTCAMGRVVNSEGEVYGVKRLRVIDASIMPNITRGNPLAATIMIAEKLSDVIKARHKY